MGWKFTSTVRRQLYLENMRKNMQFSLISISCTLVALQIYLTLFYSKNKVRKFLFYKFSARLVHLEYLSKSDILDRAKIISQLFWTFKYFRLWNTDYRRFRLWDIRNDYKIKLSYFLKLILFNTAKLALLTDSFHNVFFDKIKVSLINIFM